MQVVAQDLIASSVNRVVVGLGVTGVSCARYLYQQGAPFSVVDTRENRALRAASLDGVRTAHPVRVDNLDSSRAGARYLGRGKRDAVRPLTKLPVLIK